ncbi:MAG: acyltransferase [Syntrophobacteraceae bacterium]|jgi:peptidoglycan/LPS O-acetylase OafA/YrhL
MERHNPDTRPVTHTLKGIAISSVLINHYVNTHFSVDASGFANLFIALFYMASGYGLYYSLSNALPGETTFSRKALFLFYRDRAIRIFPLFWIALLVSGRPFPWALLGLHAPDHFWFIPTLLQCYALAPLIFSSMRKNKAILIVVVILAFTGINCLPCLGYAGQMTIKLLSFLDTGWRGFYFIYVLLFTLGLLLPCFLNPARVKHPISAKLAFCLHLASTFGFMMLLKYFVKNSLFFYIMPLPALALVFIHAIRYVIKFRVFAYLGSISYSIYLFHILYYKMIDGIGFPNRSLTNLAISIAFFPLFLYGCNKAEGLGNCIAQKLKVSIKYPLFQKTLPGC